MTHQRKQTMASSFIMRVWFFFVWLNFFCWPVLACSQPLPGGDPPLLPHEWIGNIDRVDFNEPSGICFHAQRKTLFVVGDEGDVYEIMTDGTPIQQKHLRDADFEGITHDPSTGLLYIAVEGEETILEVEPETLDIRREFAIERRFEGRLLLKIGGGGIEAITYAPDPTHPEGGTFYVANQGFSLEHEEDISAVFEIEVPLKSQREHNLSGRIRRYFRIGAIDLAGLHYDHKTGKLLIISDETDRLFELDASAGTLLRAFTLHGRDQEGIAVDEHGFLYIAQDSGGILKIRWKRE